ncbi:MAG: glutamine synthetase family protein [Thermoplasmata archaeon]
MSDEKKDAILKTVEDEGVKFVLIQFMDILGIVKSITLPGNQLERALDNGVVFDGSSIVGYATIEESDMRALPDPSTFRILPWTSGDTKCAGIVCNIHEASGDRFSGDPRYVLEMMMEKAAEGGHIFNTGPEYEFFLFKIDENGNPTTTPGDAGGYFDLLPLDEGDMVRKKTTHLLNALGYEVEASHHEAAPGQHEIDLRYTDAMTSADRVLTLKNAIRTVALEHSLHATFMPKPIFGINGSGMHTHQSLITKDGKNAFYDPDGEYQLSDTARWFLGGALAHARETCAILASWTNSYKRLVPGYEAPVHVSWANRNRSALIRVPPDREMKTRIEVRNPDPAGNPYLQYAVMLAAGLHGIENKIEPSGPVEVDIYKLPSKERQRLGIGSLPTNLEEALDELEGSDLMRETLGAHIMTHFLYIKRGEWDKYRIQVTEWETENFLRIL